MASKTVKYWNRRTSERFLDSEARALSILPTLDAIYSRALRNIEKDIKSVYENYAKNGVLDKAALKKALNQDEVKRFLRNVEIKANRLGLDPSKVYDERYLSRLSRLDALKEQIKLEVMNIAPQEEATLTKGYRRIIKDNYKAFSNDMTATGLSPVFSSLDNRVVNIMLQSVWVGDNYSNRVWGNTQKLAAKLPTILGSGLLTGQSPEKTARELRDIFNVSRYESLRLVRTEGAYFHHETEAQSYIDNGIEEYTLDVTLDNRTSKICRAVNEGKIYKFSERVVGYTWPPLHTFCRTVPRAVFSSIDRERAKKLSLEDRTKRYKTAKVSDSLKERWKKAQQKQMNPNKAAHDYNADMNLATQGFKEGKLTLEQYHAKLNDIMTAMPKDYPLRGGLENVAKSNGWVDTSTFDKNQLKVQGLLEKASLDKVGINVTPDQAKFIVDNKLKIANVQTGTDDISGAYNNETKTLNFDAVNLKQLSADLNNPKLPDHVIKHEIGHAFDASRTKEYSTTTDFKKIIGTGSAYSNEALKVSQYRMSKSIADRIVSKSIRDMTPEVYQAMLDTGESIVLGETRFRLPTQTVLYHLQPDELFAESYALYHVNKQWLHGNAPELFDYFTLLVGET